MTRFLLSNPAVVRSPTTRLFELSPLQIAVTTRLLDLIRRFVLRAVASHQATFLKFLVQANGDEKISDIKDTRIRVHEKKTLFRPKL